MIKINVITNNKNWHNYFKNPVKYIDKKINRLNKKNNIFLKKKIFCTLLLSNNKEIKYLNKKFRKKNKTTDVLSFPFHTKKDLKKIMKKETEIYLGDIIVNINKVEKRNIKIFHSKFDRLWVHGLLHLFGYDHKKDEDFLRMSQVEERFIDYING